MAALPVAVSRLREVFEYHPETGNFVRRHSIRGAHAGTIAGYKMMHGYITIQVDKRQYLAHRLAWLYMKGEWPRYQIDHKNGDPSDNRWENLREASQTQQNINTAIRKNNTSGFRGVSWNAQNNKWRARLCEEDIGFFTSKHEAHRAYQAAAAQRFGDFVRRSA